jgi:hypothetical protein
MRLRRRRYAATRSGGIPSHPTAFLLSSGGLICSASSVKFGSLVFRFRSQALLDFNNHGMIIKRQGDVGGVYEGLNWCDADRHVVNFHLRTRSAQIDRDSV